MGVRVALAKMRNPLLSPYFPIVAKLQLVALPYMLGSFLCLPFLFQFSNFPILYLEIDPLPLLPLIIYPLVRSKRFPFLSVQDVVDEQEIEVSSTRPLANLNEKIQNSMLVHQV